MYARHQVNEEDKERTWSVFASSPHDSRSHKPQTNRTLESASTPNWHRLTVDGHCIQSRVLRHTSAFKCSVIMIAGCVRVSTDDSCASAADPADHSRSHFYLSSPGSSALRFIHNFILSSVRRGHRHHGPSARRTRQLVRVARFYERVLKSPKFVADSMVDRNELTLLVAHVHTYPHV